MEVRGRDLIAGLPRTIPITSSEVMEAIEAPLQQLVAAVRHGPRADAAGALVGHHRQGHGHVRRRLAPPQHRQAPDPGDRRALPRRGERPQLRRARHGRWPSSTSTSSRSRSSSRSDRGGRAGGRRAAFVDLHCHTPGDRSISLSSPADSSCGRRAATRPDPSRDHRPRPDRRRPARLATLRPTGLTVIVGEEVQDAPTAT